MKFFINVIFKRNILNNISNNLFCFKLNVWLYTCKRTCLRIANHTSTIISPELSDTERIFAHDWSHEFWTQDENSTQKTIKTNKACSKFSIPQLLKRSKQWAQRLSQTAFQTGLEQWSINLPEPGEAKHKINPTSIPFALSSRCRRVTKFSPSLLSLWGQVVAFALDWGSSVYSLSSWLRHASILPYRLT